MSHWATSLSLIVFGVLAMFSIGRPFFLAGLATLILGPLRNRPAQRIEDPRELRPYVERHRLPE